MSTSLTRRSSVLSSFTKVLSNEHLGIQTSCWFRKRGKFFGSEMRRLLYLQGPWLTCHLDEDSEPIWIADIRETPFRVADASQKGGQEYLVVKLTFFEETFYPEDADQFMQTFVPVLASASQSSLSDFYDVVQMIGEGAYAKVYLAKGKTTGAVYAVKQVEKVPEDLDFILEEIRIAKTVCHPQIVRTYDIFDRTDELHIVMELMSGGELFDQIADAGHFSEKDASFVMRSIVKGIEYLHLHHVIHRDLKPENVLCKEDTWPLDVKLCDFGLSSLTDGIVQDGEIVGTPGYVAPEIVRQEPYGPAVDMWSAGVILFIMLSGKMPFFGRDDNDMMRRIASGTYSFPDREWKNVSDDAQNLVKALLQVDPDKRLTAQAALNHSWLRDHMEQCCSPIDNDLSGIHSRKRRFRRAVNAVITVNRLSGLTHHG